MTTITLPRATVEQALEALGSSQYPQPRQMAAITNLRAALAQEQAESLKECHKRRNDPCACSRKAMLCDGFGPPQQAEPVQKQDVELSAALGWPGGISDPVLDRKTLLQQVAALRAALAQQAEPDLSRCPQCNGPADNGFDRSFPPSPYLCKKCMAEPVEPGAWVASKDGRVIYDDASMDDSLLRVSGDFENDEQRSRYAQRIVDKLNAALAQQAEPLNLADPAVQKRLAAQWGYVPAAAQAEPVEPVQQPYCYVYEYDGVFGLHREFYPLPYNGMKPSRTVPAYTAPPQRKLVPLTEEEILAAVGWERAAMYMKLTPSFPVDEAKKETLTNARAVEKASWEKNNG